MKIHCTTYETVSEENVIKSLPQDFLMGSGVEKNETAGR